MKVKEKVKGEVKKEVKVIEVFGKVEFGRTFNMLKVDVAAVCFTSFDRDLKHGS